MLCTNDPGDNSIHDFADGLGDIEKRTIRIMGDPATRFREDPVRMLRVVRFAAKLGFTIEPSYRQAYAQAGSRSRTCVATPDCLMKPSNCL